MIMTMMKTNAKIIIYVGLLKLELILVYFHVVSFQIL